MMKVFDVKVFLILAGFLIVGCGTKSTEEYVESARAYIDKSDYSAAVIELKNAIEQNGTHAEARWLLGSVYFEAGNFLGAEKELSRALELNFSSEKVLPLYAQALLAVEKHEVLWEVSEEGLGGESLSTVLAAKAISNQVQGNINEAKSLILKAAAIEPAPLFTLVTLARFSVYEGDLAGARKQLSSVLDLDIEHVPAWSLLGDLEMGANQIDEALAAFNRVIELRPNNIDALYKASLLHLHKGDNESFKQNLGSLKKISSESPVTSFLEGVDFFHASQLDEARSAFEKVTKAGNRFPLTYYYLAAIHFQQSNFETAKNNIDTFLSIANGNVLGNKLAAALEEQEGNLDVAADLLWGVLSINPEDVTVLTQLGNVLIKQGKNDEGLELLVKAADLQPDSPEAKARVGVGYLAKGEHELGLEHLQTALALDPGYIQADIAIVTSYINKRDFQSALAAAQNFQRRNPGKAAPYNLLGSINLLSSNVDAARENWLKALEVAPGNPAANQALANLEIREKNFQAAHKRYEDILALHPGHLQTMMNVAALYALEGREKEMVSGLTEAMESYPDAISPKVVLGRYYLSKGWHEEALSLISEFTEEHRKNVEVLFLIASYEIETKSFNSANLTAKKLVDMQPDNANYSFILARSFTGLGEIESAIDTLKKTIDIEPGHAFARLALARLYIMTGQKSLFEEQLSVLKKINPEHPDVLKLDATLANQNNDQERATEILEKVFADAPSTSTVLALAIQMRKSGDLPGGLAVLERWVADHPTDLQSIIALAEFYSLNNEIGKAVEQYKTVVRLDKGNVSAYNNLAWHLRENEPKEALKYAEEAFSLSSNSVSVVDTYAMVLLANGEVTQARLKINEALNLKPENLSLRFHDAQISLAEGDEGAAKGKLEAILESDAKFAEREEAQKLLASLRD